MDVSAFYGQRFQKVGTTILLPTTEIGLTTPLTPDSQPFRSLTDMSSTPNYFSIFREHAMSVGLNAMFEDRLGGDIEYIKGNGNDTHSYFEKTRLKDIPHN